MTTQIEVQPAARFVRTLPDDAIRLPTFNGHTLSYEYYVSPMQRTVYKNEGTSFRLLTVKHGEMSLRFEPNNSQKQHIKLQDVINQAHIKLQDVINQAVRLREGPSPVCSEEEEKHEEEEEEHEEEEELANEEIYYEEYIYLHGRPYIVSVTVKITEDK